MRNVKHVIKELLIGITAVFIFINIISYIRSPDLDSNTLPSLQFRLLDGTLYTQKAGKPLLIHFWGTWCPTCKLEAANIERISKKYEVLSIAVDSGTDQEVKAYMSARELHFPVVNDKENILSTQFKVEAFPTTFIYDGNGTLRFTEVGYTSTAGLYARLKMIEN